jgi:hypothetical protein
MAVFLLLFATELLGVAREWTFFADHPKRILWLPVTAFAMGVFVFVPAAILEQGRKRGLASAPPPSQSYEGSASDVRLALCYLSMLVVLLLLMPFGLYGQLFGPTWTFLIGVVGFLSALAVLWLARSSAGIRFLRACPRGLAERFPRLQKSEIPLRRAMKIAGLIFTIGLVTLAATARLDGVPGTPVFARRAHYVLASHSVSTEVSRVRYCLAGAGFHVGWYGGASYALLLAIHTLVFARVPNPKEL